MEHELEVKSIIQANNRAQIVLQTAIPKREKPVPGTQPAPAELPAVNVAIAYTDAAMATNFVYGKTYKVTIEEIQPFPQREF